MNVLITGAAGRVAKILRPHLEAVHDCTWLDIRPNRPAKARYIVGDVLSPLSLGQAMAGQDAVIQLVMAPLAAATESHYAVHVRGMATVLEAAVKHRMSRVIYGSTMSVFQLPRQRYFASEDCVPDAVDKYGLTKQLGEQVCHAYAAAYDRLSIIVLRMVWPIPDRKWAKLGEAGEDRNFMTGPRDLGRLYLSALALQGHTGFDVIHACSDIEGKQMDMNKAKSLLGWTPEGA